jgi:predicted amidophosphoribosyltransferase
MAVKTLGYLLDRLKSSLRNDVCSFCQMTYLQEQHRLICSVCEKRILLRQPVPLMCLGAGTAYAACEFPYAIKRLIYGLKFEQKARNGVILSEVLAHYWQSLSQVPSRVMVIPIPPHQDAEFHHLSQIARPFASHFGYDYVENAFVWKRPVISQHLLLNKRKRRENVAGSLMINPQHANRFKDNMPVLILDDLLTTGATMVEALSAVNLEHSLDQVTALTVSHVPLALSRVQANG